MLARVPGTTLSFGGPLTPMVRRLLWANGLVFLLEVILLKIPAGGGLSWYEFLIAVFGLTPRAVIGRGWVWQLGTYMFLHAVPSLHIVWNMLMLWMFGGELERLWGAREFLRYYLICGVGAGLTVLAITHASGVPTIGASGALFGILLAYGMQFPNRILLLSFVFPVRARWVVVIAGLISLYYIVVEPRAGISDLAHLGGLVFGWLYLKRAWRVRQLVAELRWHWRRRRFRVYGGDDWRGPRVH